MARKHYLVSYDVADDKRRRQVYRLMRDHGDRAQYSVFFCQLNGRELAALRGALQRAIHEREDQVLIIPLRPASQNLDELIETIGQTYTQPDRVIVI